MFNPFAIVAAAIAGVALGVGLQQSRLANYKAQIAERDHQRMALVVEHEAQLQEQAAQQQRQADENQAEYIEQIMAVNRAAADRAIDAERLLNATEKRAAYYRELSQTGSRSVGYIADRLGGCERRLAKGVAVVGEQQGVLERRNAEVRALKKHIETTTHE